MPETPRTQLLRDPWLLAMCAWAAVYVGVALWTTRQGAVLTPDSMDYAEVARSLVRGQGDTINRIMFHAGVLPAIRHPLEVHGLLQPLLIAPLFGIWGPDSALVRIPSVIFASALGLAVFGAGRRLFGTAAGVIAAAIVFTRPDLLFAALLGLDDVPFALFSLAALASFWIGVEEQRRGWFIAAGVCSALAALAKFSGMALPAVLAAMLVLSPRTRQRVTLRDALYCALPLVPVLLAYVLRNYRVYGTPGSPYGAIEWFGKQDMSAYFGYYPEPPSTSEVLAHLGVSRVFELIKLEFVELWDQFHTDWLFLLGIPAALLVGFRKPAFTIGVVFFTLALLFLVCVLHHVEPRYFSGLMPVFALSLAALLGAGFDALAARVSATQKRALGAAGIALLAACVLFLAQKPLAVTRGVALSGRIGPACQDTLAYLRRSVPAAEPILAANPWLISWEADRPAVQAPTNGVLALLEVTRKYRADWAVSGAPAIGSLDLKAVLENPDVMAELRPELVFDGAACDVYRLSRDGTSKSGE
jgi:hypothetical protein